MKEIKVEAKTIQDAVEKGLAELGLRRDQVEVVVINEGSKGILGFGAKKAHICLREKKWTGGAPETAERRPERAGGRGGWGRERGGARPEHSRRGGRPNAWQRAEKPETAGPAENSAPDSAPANARPAERNYRRTRPEPVYTDIQVPAEAAKPSEDPLEHAKSAFARILELMGVRASVAEAAYNEKEGLITLKFESAEAGVFTSENARGLEALQFLIGSIVNRGRRNRSAVRIDTGDYWKTMEAEILKQVEQAVKNVMETARPYRMDPMSAPLRKYVHGLVKSSYPGVETVSEGEGRWRKVVIRPPMKTEEAAKH